MYKIHIPVKVHLKILKKKKFIWKKNQRWAVLDMRRSKSQKQKIYNFSVYRMRPVAYIKQNLTNLAEIPIGWANQVEVL